MIEGGVALTPLPQADGQARLRPAVRLRKVPPSGDGLVCGVGTQLHHEAVGFDDLIEPSHLDFAGSGLKAPSLVRLGFVAALPSTALLGDIGCISSERHERLLQRLDAFLRAPRST